MQDYLRFDDDISTISRPSQIRLAVAIAISSTITSASAGLLAGFGTVVKRCLQRAFESRFSP